MPELPEIETVKRSLLPKLQGKTLTRIIFRREGLRWPFPDVGFLEGKKVKSVDRRSKYLLIEFAQGTLLIHLGMSGSLRWVNSKEMPEKHDHMDLVFGDHAVRLKDPRRFGSVVWQPKGELHPSLEQLGPEPLEEEFDGKAFKKRIENKKNPIKVALMDPQVVVGVGNIYASEALFRARIDPRRLANTLNPKECTTLVGHVKDVLEEGIAKGGSTLRDFHGVEGQVGSFAAGTQVYGRSGQPCVLCQEPLDTVRLGGRASVWCPRCQA